MYTLLPVYFIKGMVTFTVPPFTELLLSKSKYKHKSAHWSYLIVSDSGYGFNAGAFAVDLP